MAAVVDTRAALSYLVADPRLGPSAKALMDHAAGNGKNVRFADRLR